MSLQGVNKEDSLTLRSTPHTPGHLSSPILEAALKRMAGSIKYNVTFSPQSLAELSATVWFGFSLGMFERRCCLCTSMDYRIRAKME